MDIKLDQYEQSIEDDLENFVSVKNKSLINNLQKSAKKHMKNKKPVTIRIAVHDIEAIKIKASKNGLSYQTYINMLIHRDAITI